MAGLRTFGALGLLGGVLRTTANARRREGSIFPKPSDFLNGSFGSFPSFDEAKQTIVFLCRKNRG
jgi:hypothetical protein